MKENDERLRLLDQLIQMTRLACRKGEPDTMVEAAEILRFLEPRRDELTAQLELPVGKEGVPA